jgi:hypothetical protein
MKQQTLEKFEYSAKDIESLIYQDILKRGITANRARVNVYFSIGSDPSDNDYQAAPRQILECANVTVDTTK